LEVGAATTTVPAVVDVAVADVIVGADGGAAGVVIVDAAVVATPLPTAFFATVEIRRVTMGAPNLPTPFDA
jgi:hypothetical protein